MIDQKTGLLNLTSELTVSPNLTREQFLSLPISKKASIFLKNEPWCSYQIKVEIPDKNSNPELWSIVIYFEGSDIQMLHLTILGEKQSESCAEYSTKKEMDRKKRHDDWLKTYLGLSSKRNFPWGKIASVYDARSAESLISITYNQQQKKKQEKKEGVISLPAICDADGEKDKFISRMKKRATKNFKWTVSRSLEDMMYLAFWFYVLGREDEALEVCTFLSQYEFEGNFNIWRWVEYALALQARIFRNRDKKDEREKTLKRIRTYFEEDRLNGIILNLNKENVQDQIEAHDKKREADWRAVMMLEQCIIIEMGGSKQLPVKNIETEFQDNISKLKELVGKAKE
ncbi:MAG: hypothetical protein HQK78_12315 [Desulfobacterales bacterium]|nr:hypothetical protein [Desulfobacterales bacterium]